MIELESSLSSPLDTQRDNQNMPVASKMASDEDNMDSECQACGRQVYQAEAVLAGILLIT